MKTLRYIDGVATISLDGEKCIGCGMCTQVCPHDVFMLTGKKALIIDRDGCMECGACAMNCPVEAISVNPGVGCASLIISRWLKGKNMPAGGCC
jgi:NAD-dependent dihydropyrimidine dehydrogenase PreA subunit